MELDGADEVVFSIGPHGVHVIVLLKLDAAIVNVHERSLIVHRGEWADLRGLRLSPR
jgi:hypothetical protein